MRSLMMGTLLEIIINSMHIMTSVTPLNINFSVDSGGSQNTDSVRNTTTKSREYKKMYYTNNDNYYKHIVYLMHYYLDCTIFVDYDII